MVLFSRIWNNGLFTTLCMILSDEFFFIVPGALETWTNSWSVKNQGLEYSVSSIIEDGGRHAGLLKWWLLLDPWDSGLFLRLHEVKKMVFRRDLLAHRADGIETNTKCASSRWLGLLVVDLPHEELFRRRASVDDLGDRFQVLREAWWSACLVHAHPWISDLSIYVEKHNVPRSRRWCCS